MGKLQATMKRFASAMVQPVMYLAASGILMIIGVLCSSFGSGVIKETGSFLYTLLSNATINQLPVLFCVGIAAALAKKKKGDAALISLCMYLIFVYANNAWLTNHGMLAAPGAFGMYGTGQAMVLGVQVVDAGVFLGIALGCIVAWCFNKFCDVKAPDIISIYGGTRFVFLVSSIITIVLAIVMCYVWPVVNGWISALANFIANSGNIGLFVYGFLNRFLIPTGLHHIVYMPFLATEVGGTLVMGDTAISGAMMIWYAQMGMSEYITEIHESVKWMNYGMAKTWGAIGATAAFIITAKPEKRAKTFSTLVPSAMVAILSGITEPLEFMFLFISPLLWFVHSVLEGIFGVITYAAGARVPMYGGLLNLFTSSIAFPTEMTKWYIALLVGIPATIIWTVLFVVIIKKKNLKTPGREDDEDEDVAAIALDKSKSKSQAMGDVNDIIEGLGGKDNIVAVNNCFTRLRVDVKDVSLVDDARIKKFKNSGIVKKDTNIQIIIGLSVPHVKSDVCAALGIDD